MALPRQDDHRVGPGQHGGTSRMAATTSLGIPTISRRWMASDRVRHRQHVPDLGGHHLRAGRTVAECGDASGVSC